MLFFPAGSSEFPMSMSNSFRRMASVAAGLVLGVTLTACHGRSSSAPSPVAGAPVAPKPLSVVAQLGRKLFYDPSLSISGKQSCASCHSPEHAYGPANALPAQLGGPDLRQQGLRAVPSLRYLSGTPNFSVGPDNSPGDDPHLPATAITTVHPTATGQSQPLDPARLAARPSGQAKVATTVNLVPQGGFFWDGRADTLQGQALGPLLNPMEMGNPDVAALVQKLQQLSYLDDFKKLFGERIAENKPLLLSEALFAIARYEGEDPSFQPYDSKYDAYLHGAARLSAAEMRGLKLFEDRSKGNCAACHPDKPGADGRPPVFTDYQFEALGVPRNHELHANADPVFHDLAVCGPVRGDAYSKQAQNCGLFKTPSLRNVATRQAFFHNGIYHKLEDVLRFYAERDLHPEKFYPTRADGSVDAYDDLPQQYRANLDTVDAPFDRKPGQAPALDEAEQRDIIAFLGTLTDGYRPE